MGFKSVAHFLIQTKRSKPSSVQNPTDLASAKRSLSFTNFEVNPAGSPKVNDNLLETMEHHAVDESENEKQNIPQSKEIKDYISVKRSLSFSGLEQQGSKETKPPNHFNHGNEELSQLQSENDELAEDVISEKEKERHCLKRKNGNYCPSDECPITKKIPTIAVESNNTMDLGCGNDDHSEKELLEVQASASSTDQSLKKNTDISSQTSSESTTKDHSLEEEGCKTSEAGSNSLSNKKM